MKALFKLVGLVCLSCSALHAGMYLTALQAKNGQYVCAEGGGGGGLNANRDALGPWETFVVEDLWAGTQAVVYGDPVGIRSVSSNKYWCSPSNTYYTMVDRDVRGPWETFVQVGQFENGNRACFLDWWQTFVSAFGGGGAQLGREPPGYYAHIDFTVTILAYIPDPAP